VKLVSFLRVVLAAVINQVLAQHAMGETCLAVSRDFNKSHGANAAGLLQNRDYSVTDLVVTVVQMDENVLHCVVVETAGPADWQHVKEDLESLGCLDSNEVLSVIESLEQLLVEFFEHFVIVVLPRLEVSHDLLDEEHGRESQLVVPVVVETAFEGREEVVEILEKLLGLDQVVGEESHRGDHSGFPDRVGGDAGTPLDARHQHHLNDDLTIKHYCRVKVLGLQEMFAQVKHVHPEFPVFFFVDTGGHDLEDLVPEINHCGLRPAHKHVEHESLRRVLVPAIVILLHVL
jgi:hypothetical protein